MPISSLSSQYISASWQNLVQVSSSGNLYDGVGNLISSITVANLYGTLSGSVATASYIAPAAIVSAVTAAGFGAQGSDTYIQFNSASAFNASSALKFNYNYYSLENGLSLTTLGNYSHAEGRATKTNGDYSHAEGSGSIALGDASHAEGFYTIASGSYQHVSGKFNEHGDTTSLFIVGNGTSNSNRSDAFLVRESGSIVMPTTQSAAPTWAGRDGEIVPATVGGVHRLYMYMGGSWRSASFA